MRTLWAILTTVAVANVIGLVGFVAFLAVTDRLSADRVERIREVLMHTVSDERRQKEAADARAKAESAKVEEERKLAQPPVPASESIIGSHEMREVAQQQVMRLQREVDDLRRALATERGIVEKQALELATSRKAFEAQREQARRIEGTDQFKRALATLEAQKPAQAKSVLRAIIDLGQLDQAVAYLNAMQERVRAKIIAEFVKEDAKMAADLLERLRTRGLVLGTEGPSK